LDYQNKFFSKIEQKDWLWKKIKTPKQIIIFMWLAISNIMLIWEIQKEVLTWNIFASHFLRKCSYSKQIWIELEYIIGVKEGWVGYFIEECLKKWMSKRYLK